MTGYVVFYVTNLIMFLGILVLLKLLYERLDLPENRDLFLTVIGLGMDLVGWFAIAHCEELSTAMVCLRLSYFGRILFACGYVRYIARVYKAKHSLLVVLPVVLTLGAGFVHSLLDFSVDPFLSDIRLIEKGGVRLVYGIRGPLYDVHTAGVCIIGIWSVLVVLRSLTRDGGKTAGKVKLNDFFYVGAVLLQGISFTVYELDYGNIINLVPLVRALCTGIYAGLSLKYHFLNFDTLARQSLMNDVGAGYVVLSDKYEILFVNDIAARLFPQVTREDTEFLKSVTRKREYQFEKNGSTYKVTADRIFNNGKVEGYTVLIVDITDIITLEKQAVANEKNRQNLLTNISHELKTPLNALIGASEVMNSEDVSKETYKDYAELIRVSTMNLDDILNDILTASSAYGKPLVSDMAPYSVFTLVENIVGMCNERVSRKKVKLSVSMAEDIPVNAIGDDRRIRQVILNILTNAIRYTDDGYVSLRVSGEYFNDGRFEYIYTIQDTGRNVFNNAMDIERAFSEGDALGMDYNTGYGISLVVAKKIANALGGDVSMYSIKGKGNVYSVVLPSQILNTKTLSGFEFDRKLSITFFGESDVMFEDLKHSCYELDVANESVSAISKVRKIGENDGKYPVVLFDFDKYGKKVVSSDRFEKYIKVAVLTTGSVPKNYNDDFIFVRTPLSALTLHHVLSEIENRVSNTQSEDDFFTAPSAKVLVVDDNTLNLEIARTMLEQFKISVDMAESGYECLDLINSGQSYDLIFMDYMMEGMDGIETTGKIRELPGNIKNVPIVAYTANSVEGAGEKYLSAGMNGFVFKPAGTQAFANALKTFLPKELLVYEKGNGASRKALPTDEFPDIEEIDMEKARRYSGDNIDMFTDMIASFVRETPEKEKKMLEYIKDKNFKDFTILVHGIKGLARTMGMTAFSERMAAMEKAGADCDEAYINKNLPELLSGYRHYAGVLAPYAAEKLEKKVKKVPKDEMEAVLLEMLELLEEFEIEKTEKLFSGINFEESDESRKPLIRGLKDSIEKVDYYASKEYVEELLATYADEKQEVTKK